MDESQQLSAARLKRRGLMKPGEVAALMDVDPKTVTRWAKSGKIRAIRTPGGHRRFFSADVAKLLQGEDPQSA